MENRPLNIIDLFLQRADEVSERKAIIYKGTSVSFGDLKKQVIATAATFRKKGVRPGDRVLVFVPMSIDLYRSVLALFYMGAVAVFLDEWVSKKRLEACCEIADCKAFIGNWKVQLLALFSGPLRRLPVRLGLGYNKKIDDFPKQQTHSNDTALLTFTTGTTGTPKAAKRTHGFLKEQFDALLEKIDPKAGETDMPALPIVLLINLGAGCSSVIPDFKMSKPEEMKTDLILTQINDNKVERIVASPFFVKKLAEELNTKGQTNASVKKVFTGGAPVFADEAALYLKAFRNAKIEIVYGSTEAEPISAIDAGLLVNDGAEMLDGGLLVGKPYRKANVRIIEMHDAPIYCNNEEDLDAVTQKAGIIGEITVSGPHVLREYFNNEAALLRNKIFIGVDCWHRTGDSGYLDDEGNLFLTGRVQSLIHHNGKIWAPFIFQNRLQSVNGIVLATIIKRNEKITAVVELKNDADKESVRKAIDQLGLGFDDVLFIPKMPRDPRHNSRIDYELLNTCVNGER